MKIGYNQATAMKKSSLSNDLVLLEKYGYDYIEIRLDMLEEYLKTHSLDELADFFSKSKLKPYAINSIEEINFRHGKELDQIKESVEYACKVAQKINNPYIVVVPTFVDREKVKKYNVKEIEEDTVRMLNIFADIAEKYNVKLALEPIGFDYCTINSISKCAKIIKMVNRESIGMVVDAFNLYLHDSLKDVKDLEEIDVEKIFVFHIDDCESLSLDQLDHCHRMWPGDGVIPLDSLLEVLKKKGFDKIASIELFRPEYWELPPEEVIKTGKEKTEAVLKRHFI